MNENGENADEDEVDWAKTNCVPPFVLDQGQCGSCWAFSAAGMTETTFNQKSKICRRFEAVQFSPQQILDCQKTAGSCKGGWPIRVPEMYRREGGSPHGIYVYKGKDNRECDETMFRIKPIGLKESKYIGRNQETFIEWNRKVVLSIILSVNKKFVGYKGGIYDDETCVKTRVGLHAVTLNGFSTKGGYWILRNSWGARWGERGYMKLKKSDDNLCGIYNNGLYFL